MSSLTLNSPVVDYSVPDYGLSNTTKCPDCGFEYCAICYPDACPNCFTLYDYEEQQQQHPTTYINTNTRNTNPAFTADTRKFQS